MGTIPRAIYTVCANTNSTVFSGGNGLYEYCKRQLIKYDPTRSDAGEVIPDPSFYSCHELGHTTGLQHPSPLHNNPRPRA